MRDLRSNNHVVYLCRYHVVFCPKYRRKVLTPPIDERLKVFVAEQIERWGQALIAHEVMPDHVHLLVGCDPQVGLHRLIKLLKGSCAHTRRQECPSLKRRLPSLWTNADCVATTGGVTRATRKRYVEQQKDKCSVAKPMVRQTFQYPLRPTLDQERVLERTLMRCRDVDHAAMGERRAAWRMRGVWVTSYQQKAELPDSKAVLPASAEVHRQVVQHVVQRVDRAFPACFRRVEGGQAAGSPRCPSRERSHRFTDPQAGNGATLDHGVLVLTTSGRMAVRWSRPPAGAPQTVTISREADGWSVCCSCADVPVQALPPTGHATGMDVGLAAFATRSTGDQSAHPRRLRVAERARKRAQRRVSRRTRGSHRRRQAVALLATAQQQVRRQRADFQHKTALALVQHYATLYLEDWQVANMLRNRTLATSIADAGWGPLRTILEGTAGYAGRRVVAVPPAYTSQECSGCGERVPKRLRVRTPVCTSCGLVLDRDENAALHLLRAGQARQALTQRVAADVA
jgi:putative transposase